MKINCILHRIWITMDHFVSDIAPRSGTSLAAIDRRVRPCSDHGPPWSITNFMKTPRSVQPKYGTARREYLASRLYYEVGFWRALVETGIFMHFVLIGVRSPGRGLLCHSINLLTEVGLPSFQKLRPESTRESRFAHTRDYALWNSDPRIHISYIFIDTSFTLNSFFLHI